MSRPDDDEPRPAVLALCAALRRRELTYEQQDRLTELLIVLDRADRLDPVPKWAPVKDAYAALLALMAEGQR